MTSKAYSGNQQALLHSAKLNLLSAASSFILDNNKAQAIRLATIVKELEIIQGHLSDGTQTHRQGTSSCPGI